MTEPALALDHRRAEGGQVGVLQVVRGGMDVVAVAAGLGTAMDGIVLGRGHRAQIDAGRRPAAR